MEKIDEFLYGILKQNFTETSSSSEINFNFLCRSEDFIISFLTCRNRFELEFPALNSYHRRIIHRLGRRYNLVHRVEPTNSFNLNSTLRKIYLNKPVEIEECAVDTVKQLDFNFPSFPLLKCFDWLKESISIQNDQIFILINPHKDLKDSNKPISEHLTIIKKSSKKKNTLVSNSEVTRQTATPKFKILKRDTTNQITPSSLSSSTTSPTIISSSPLNQLPFLESLSLEEREAKYQEARERIFEGFQADDEDSDEAVTMPVVPSFIKTEIDSVNEEVVSFTLKDTEKNNLSSSSCILNPEAIPFTFNSSNSDSNYNRSDSDSHVTNNNFNLLLQTQKSITIQINHIYTLKPKLSEASLTDSILQRILKIYSPAVIKTVQIPTNFAFLLSNCVVEDNNDERDEPWIVEKWIPEFYLD